MSLDDHRTKAEQRVDSLSAEARSLRALTSLTKEQRDRIRQIAKIELPKAWRAVNKARNI